LRPGPEEKDEEDHAKREDKNKKKDKKEGPWVMNKRKH
jgi:hypothetical protein